VSGRITAIQRAREGSSRLAVFVDGRPAFTVSEEIAARLGLEVGVELAQDQVERIEADSERAKAKEKALGLLTVRARSRRELLDRLRRSGFDTTLSEEVVADLEVVGLVDDEAFARLWAGERVRLRPVGPMLLRQELRAKGVDQAVTTRILDETYEENPEIELARRASLKKTRKHEGGLPDRERAKLFAYLVRRGFSHEVVAAVVRERMENRDGGADDVG